MEAFIQRSSAMALWAQHAKNVRARCLARVSDSPALLHQLRSSLSPPPRTGLSQHPRRFPSRGRFLAPPIDQPSTRAPNVRDTQGDDIHLASSRLLRIVGRPWLGPTPWLNNFTCLLDNICRDRIWYQCLLLPTEWVLSFILYT